MNEKYIFDTQFIINAGGLGERWRDVSSLPKPLTPIGKHKKPMIEYVILSFMRAGIEEFYITLYYKPKLFINCLKKIKEKYKIKINYLIEGKERLGRLGIIKKSFEEGLLDANRPLVSANASDILIFDMKKAFDFHLSNLNFPVTAIVSKNFKSSFGILELGKYGNVVSFKEKPYMQYFTNTAFYIIDKKFNKKILKAKLEFPINFEDFKSFWKFVKAIPLVEYGKTWFPFKDLKDYREFGDINFLHFL